MGTFRFRRHHQCPQRLTGFPVGKLWVQTLLDAGVSPTATPVAGICQDLGKWLYVPPDDSPAVHSGARKTRGLLRCVVDAGR